MSREGVWGTFVGSNVEHLGQPEVKRQAFCSKTWTENWLLVASS